MNQIALNPTDWFQILLRLTLACLVGGVIGWEREVTGKSGGFRTHMLVSLGSALFVATPLLAGSTIDSNAVSRTIQGVATGVGFLGAGEIVQRSRNGSDMPQIQGLTSAASIWLTAALGLLAVCGFWQVCLIGSALTLIVLRVIKRVERQLRVDSNG